MSSVDQQILRSGCEEGKEGRKTGGSLLEWMIWAMTGVGRRSSY